MAAAAAAAAAARASATHAHCTAAVSISNDGGAASRDSSRKVLLGCTLSIEVHHAATTMVPSWDSEPTNVIKICAIVALVTTNNVELHWFAKFSAHTDVFMWPFIIRTAVAPGTTHWRHGTMWRPRRGPTCGVGDSSCRSQCCSTTAMHSNVCLWFARAAAALDNLQHQPAETCIGRLCQAAAVVELAAVAAKPTQTKVPLKLRALYRAWSSISSSSSSCSQLASTTCDGLQLLTGRRAHHN
jgi:hypothetical protein